MIGLLLLVAAFVCFVLAALGVQTKIGLLSAGLACWVLDVILSTHAL